PNKKRAGKNLIREYEKSVFDALKEIEFYRKLMFMANENKIRDTLLEIITDKIAHAIKFNFILK
ncbi:MAG: hypothetical protein FWD82_06935, partial [Defluviitaleaceae bacterium]|nr:hypothetical protein [Defluviitaleaceae bacterium]